MKKLILLYTSLGLIDIITGAIKMVTRFKRYMRSDKESNFDLEKHFDDPEMLFVGYEEELVYEYDSETKNCKLIGANGFFLGDEPITTGELTEISVQELGQRPGANLGLAAVGTSEPRTAHFWLPEDCPDIVRVFNKNDYQMEDQMEIEHEVLVETLEQIALNKTSVERVIALSALLLFRRMKVIDATLMEIDQSLGGIDADLISMREVIFNHE